MSHYEPFAGVGQSFTLTWDQLQSFRRALRDKGADLRRGDAIVIKYQEFVDALTEADLFKSYILPKDIAKRSCVCVFSPGEDSRIYIFIAGTFCHGTGRQVPLPSARRVLIMSRFLRCMAEEGGPFPKSEARIVSGIDDLT